MDFSICIISNSMDGNGTRTGIESGLMAEVGMEIKCCRAGMRGNGNRESHSGQRRIQWGVQGVRTPTLLITVPF